MVNISRLKELPTLDASTRINEKEKKNRTKSKIKEARLSTTRIRSFWQLFRMIGDFSKLKHYFNYSLFQ